MKLIASFVLFASLTPLFAADHPTKSGDPFAGALFPPELVLRARDQIGLTPEQLETIRTRMEKTQQSSEELRGKMERETAALAALTNQQRVEEATLLAQLDKVLDVEREVKHLHIGMALALKNLLTPEQQARLREISSESAKNHSAFAKLDEEAGKRISAKVERVKEGAQKWGESGRDTSDIRKTMEEKFKPLIEAGKASEAEAVLDHVLEQLEQRVK